MSKIIEKLIKKMTDSTITSQDLEHIFVLIHVWQSERILL